MRHIFFDIWREGQITNIFERSKEFFCEMSEVRPIQEFAKLVDLEKCSNSKCLLADSQTSASMKLRTSLPQFLNI